MSGLAFRRVWAILRRDYVQRVKNKWFLITTLGFPLLVVGVSFLFSYLAITGDSGGPLRLGVVDRAGIGAERVAEQLTEADSSLRAEALPDTAATGETPQIRTWLRASDREALLVLEPAVLEGRPAVLLTRRSVSEPRQRTVRDAVRQVVVRAKLETSGLTAEDASSVYRTSRLDLRVSRVDQEASQSQDLLTGLALFFTFALYMLFLIYGQIITRGVLEEKTSDIVEILVSSVRPWELMLGKVLGIGAMGLTQIAIWIATIALFLGYGLMARPPMLEEILAALQTTSAPFLELGLMFLLFFLLGYFLYASLFAAVGAMVGDQDEVQQVSFIPIILIMVPFFMAFSAAQAGTVDSTWMVASSYFPFFTPILMLTRVTMGAAAAWEVVASVLLMILSIGAVAWVAGRIYRVGILMKGKRPTLPELVRWVRYG